MSGQGMIDSAVEMLIDGRHDGRAVVEWLRTTFVDPGLAKGSARSVASLNGTLTRVRNALKARGLEPASLTTFRLNDEEALALKRQQEESQILKNENLIVIADARALYKTLVALLETAKPTMPFPRLILPLLFCSGRRLRRFAPHAPPLRESRAIHSTAASLAFSKRRRPTTSA